VVKPCERVVKCSLNEKKSSVDKCSEVKHSWVKCSSY